MVQYQVLGSVIEQASRSALAGWQHRCGAVSKAERLWKCEPTNTVAPSRLTAGLASTLSPVAMAKFHFWPWIPVLASTA